MINATVPTASQAEAEAGMIDEKAMTPLRVKQAIDALGVSQDVLASSSGGERVGVVGGGTAADFMAGRFTAQQRGAIGNGIANDGPALQDAMTRAAATGDELVMPGGTYLTDIGLICGAVRVRCLGPVTIRYTGSTHIAQLLKIDAAGGDVSISGKLRVDSNNKANVGIYLINDHATRVDAIFGDVECINCRMVAGNGFNTGAYGILALGNFDIVRAERLAARDIGRAAGTGSPGSFGTMGIHFGRVSGYAPRVIDITLAEASNILCDDAVGSANRVDCDGIALYQNDENGASCRVGTIIGKECMGRTYKNQSYRATRVEQVRVERSVQGITGARSVEVNFQYGEGSASNVDIEYSGDALKGNAPIPISFFTSLARSSYGVMHVGHLAVRDKTAGPEMLEYLVDFFNGAGSTSSKSAIIGSVELRGANPVKYLARIGPNGNSDPFDLTISRFRGTIDAAALQCNAPMNYLTGVFTSVQNTGAEVPLIADITGTPLENKYGRIREGGGNIGIAVNRGVRHGVPGIAPLTGEFMYDSSLSGRVPLGATYLENGTDIVLPLFGYVPSTGIFTILLPETGERGVYQVTGANNTITTITAIASVVTDSSGAEPGSGAIRVWKVNGGANVKIKAVGAGKYISVTGDV
ncbi:hypothetical protein [Sphingopyxis sp.]|uniref:hypothetical protein n=1 Tax=Sphingopyxis sp. TaxID=1908224 RepID=UPI0035AEAE52